MGQVKEGTTLLAPNRIDSLFKLVSQVDSFATAPSDDLNEMDYNYAQTVVALVTLHGLVESMIKSVSTKYTIAQEDHE